MAKPARCEHIKTNGTRCDSPALRGRRLCYFHYNCRLPQIQLVPILEDGTAIQLGLLEIIRALLDERIDTKRAGLVLYALQIAALNLRHVDGEPGAHRVVLDPPCEMQYPYLRKPPRSATAEQTTEAQAPSARTGSDV